MREVRHERYLVGVTALYSCHNPALIPFYPSVNPSMRLALWFRKRDRTLLEKVLSVVSYFESRQQRLEKIILTLQEISARLAQEVLRQQTMEQAIADHMAAQTQQLGLLTNQIASAGVDQSTLDQLSSSIDAMAAANDQLGALLPPVRTAQVDAPADPNAAQAVDPTQAQ